MPGGFHRPHLKSVSHSTHTKQVPFASWQPKGNERQLQMGTRPGTPLPALPKDLSPSQVDIMAYSAHSCAALLVYTCM